MASLLLTVFILQVVIHLINTVGAATINELLWLLYSKLPTPTSKSVQEQVRLKREVVRLKRELNRVSAQDEFGKWAKLDRQHRKAMQDYEKSASTTTATRASFDRAVTTLRWSSTNGLRFFLQYWYAKQPLFWIPAGWVPGYVEWLLSFPRAPIGSVSVQIWDIACTSVVQLAGEALAAMWALEVERRRASARGQKKAQMQGRSAAGGGTGGEKEL